MDGYLVTDPYSSLVASEEANGIVELYEPSRYNTEA
jgi:hypothetical protein